MGTPPAVDAEPPAVDRHRFETTILDRLKTVFAANPWLSATEYSQGSVRIAAAVKELTDQPVMAVGAMSGVGPVDETIPLVTLGMEARGSMVANMHRGQAALANPDPASQAAVDRWDPDGLARSIGSFTGVARQLMGRPTFGTRREQWLELEDKLAIEPLWKRAGIAVAPSRQVALDDRAAVLAAHRDLATDGGTVWAGDNSTGWHGGGDGTFWVPDLAAADTMATAALDRFRLVRIMPFVAGVPCSIHAMVVPDGAGGTEVVVFRPCEMMTVRDTESRRFVYCRAATYWDPRPEDRVAMSRAARAIGIELVRQVDYRGVFTVDGVMGDDGFVPTEVNTRYGAALRAAHQTMAGETIDLMLLNLAVVEGRFDDLDLRLLGPVVTEQLDRQRAGRALLQTPVAPPEERRAAVHRRSDGELAVTELPVEDQDDGKTGDDPRSVATVTLGTADGATGFAMVELIRAEVGPPTGPLVVEIAEALDRYWSLGLPPLVAATSVR